jgi:hypothetical protein
MNYALFASGAVEDFPYRRLLSLLPEREEIYWVTHRPVEQRQEGQVRILSREELGMLDPGRTVAIVTHPLWIQVLARFAPHSCIAILTPCPEGESALLWEKYCTHLAALATMVCTPSEQIYLEQCFRRASVLLLTGEETVAYDLHETQHDILFLRDYEVVFRDAVRAMIEEQSLDSWVRCQWLSREKYYREMLTEVRSHDTIAFLLSVYQYLLNRKEARDSLLHAFEHAVLAGKADALQNHFRFLSAIEAKVGDVEHAVSLYGITALSDQEKRSYRSLLEFLVQGEHALVLAEIFRLNDDFLAAESILREQKSDQARRIWLQIALKTGNLDRALELLCESDLRSKRDRRDAHLLKGTFYLMRGERFPAIQSFLKAATYDQEVLDYIVEIRELEEAIRRL